MISYMTFYIIYTFFGDDFALIWKGFRLYYGSSTSIPKKKISEKFLYEKKINILMVENF